MFGLDPSGTRQKGHHYIPESVWRTICPDNMDYWTDNFDTAESTISVKGHNGTAHYWYNIIILEGLLMYMKFHEISCDCLKKMDPKQVILATKAWKNKYVSGFIEATQRAADEGGDAAKYVKNWMNANPTLKDAVRKKYGKLSKLKSLVTKGKAKIIFKNGTALLKVGAKGFIGLVAEEAGTVFVAGAFVATAQIASGMTSLSTQKMRDAGFSEAEINQGSVNSEVNRFSGEVNKYMSEESFLWRD